MSSKQEQNSRNKKLVNDLLKIPSNKVCADCNARGPQWASTTQGVFFCIRCAGLHRKLGTHISKVRSVGLDSWNDEQRRMVELFGNEKANTIFEAKLDREKPTADTDTATVEKFIRAKYERKLWIDNDAYAREYGNLDLNSEDSSPATTPTTPLKQSISTQNFQQNRQQNLRSVSSQDDIANPPPQKQTRPVQQVKQPPVQQSNTPSLITFEDTPKQNDLSEFIIMDNTQTGQRTQVSSKDSVLNLFDSPLQPTARSNQPPQQQQQQQPFTIPGGPPPLNNNGMGRGMNYPPPLNNGMGMNGPPPLNNGMGRGMGYPPPLNNGMGMGMNGPPPLNNGMGMNGPPPMMGRGYPPQGFNNGMGMMNGPPPLNNGMGMGMNGPPPLNNGMGMNGPPMMGRGYPQPGYNPAMRF
ncbi:arfGTPase-activating protein [Naegleria gruberi]|uniref:ArfGTPase-activating protein n=1 Tax=Naegleria gruberi TaxID=5762 RepID=D2UX07_NAEGR|nr:arfGTPase-activating protein [Naegleria gruberi]EFC50849.1 arfGTPase-activating protein [Naegleria gruberi]|eukprot:XP_002683593.1 arfGTPase-activating protein [Naegleria gruberi strain NEG-M]